MSNIEGASEKFPQTVLAEVQQRQAELRQRKQANRLLGERFTLLGVGIALRSGIPRSLRSAEIARQLDTTESTLYRYIPKPIFTTMEEWAGKSLKSEFFRRRQQFLFNTAAELAVDSTIDFDESISQWSKAYGAVANPAAVVSAETSLRGEYGFIGDHASTIAKSVRLLALKEGLVVDDSFGFRVFPADESPQLWNIWKKEMSVVGPRALLPVDLEIDKHILGTKAFNERMTIRGLALPGIYDEFSVRYHNGELPIDREERLLKRVDLENRYILEEASFSKDIEILQDTARLFVKMAISQGEAA